MSSSFSPDELAYQQAHAGDNLGPMLIGVGVMFLVLCAIAVACRVLSRWMIKKELGWDDWSIFAAMFLQVGLVVETIVLVHYGTGHHAITLTPDLGEKLGKATFVLELTYPVLIISIKASVLALYRRLFTMRIPLFKWGWWANIVYLFGWSVAIYTVELTTCKPISDFWNPQTQDVCRVSYVPGIVLGALNALSDLGILLLPMPVVWGLQMGTKQKVATSGIFLLGSFVIIVSIVRIPSLKAASSGVDATYEEVQGLIWTIAEPSVGLICACLPVMRPLFRGLLDKTQSPNKPSKTWTNRGKSSQWSNIKGEDTAPINSMTGAQYSAHAQASGEKDFPRRDEEYAARAGIQITSSFSMQDMGRI